MCATGCEERTPLAAYTDKAVAEAEAALEEVENGKALCSWCARGLPYRNGAHYESEELAAIHMGGAPCFAEPARAIARRYFEGET